MAERRGETLMHMDGCHFFVWVFKDPDGATVITYAERTNDNLRLHGRYGEDGDDTCSRCRALRDREARPLLKGAA